MKMNESCRLSLSSLSSLSSQRIRFYHWNDDSVNGIPMISYAKQLWGKDSVTHLIGGPFSDQQIEEKFNREIENERRHGVQYWPIFSTEANGEHTVDPVFIGCCGLRPYAGLKSNEVISEAKILANKEVIYELGFHLLPEFWGKGYGKETAQTVIKYAFETLKADILFAGHNPANVASKSLLEKIGFQYDHDEFYHGTGLMHPSYYLYRS
jgi:ribosomal-protein-alanine N-acetyltransferase